MDVLRRYSYFYRGYSEVTSLSQGPLALSKAALIHSCSDSSLLSIDAENCDYSVP